MKNALNFELGDEVIYYLDDTRIHLYVVNDYNGNLRLGIRNSLGDKDHFYILDKGEFVKK